MPKLRIIIADDIFTNRLLLSEIIEDLGHTYITVENGREAVNALVGNEIDVVLMDIEMPVMNGLEATKHIREKLGAPKCHTPVVALTAHNPKIFFDDYKDVGFSQLLTKPYSVKKITDLLESFKAKADIKI
ncbi:MAG: response regulator [Alphaproteobacteria bacterium]|nr:MAG: response regulator [Alphaproteobacteria bacterium]